MPLIENKLQKPDHSYCSHKPSSTGETCPDSNGESLYTMAYGALGRVLTKIDQQQNTNTKVDNNERDMKF